MFDMSLFRLDKIFKRFIVIFTIAQSSVDKTHQRDVATKAEGFIRGTEDVLMEDVFDALFLEPQA